MSQHPALRYLRSDAGGKPHTWCPGCGIGQIFHYTVKAIDLLGLDSNSVVWVGGAGCNARMCTYWAYDFMHTLHGRPLAFATGLKVSKPELKVIVHTGDGDAAAIGGNHLIQTARRNVELLTICLNNYTYGMTGGQFSPTTPVGAKTMTSPRVAWSVLLIYAVSGRLWCLLCRPLDHRPSPGLHPGDQERADPLGFSFVEIVSQCPTQYGRSNRLGDGVAMLNWMKANSVKVTKAAGYSDDELAGKIIVGEFVDRERADYGAVLRGLAERSGKRNESCRGTLCRLWRSGRRVDGRGTGPSGSPPRGPLCRSDTVLWS